MKLQQLMEQARQFPLFQIEDCQKWFPSANRGVMLLQLSGYVRQGYFSRLQRGLYLLNSAPFPQPFAIASRLKPDAIISLETVLSEAGLLPETALAVTAVTGQRNSRLALSAAGSFIFHHLPPALLFGWRLEQFPPYSVRVAYPEKALLDFLWFHQREKNPASYLDGLRLSFPSQFSWSRFRSFARQFPNQRFHDLARLVERHYKH